MLVNNPEIYESWNLEKSNIPSHSRLYALEPVGIGTPYIESLTSYIARLAETHSVPTGVLVLSEIAPFLKEGYTFKTKDGGLDQIFANHTQALNGTGTWVIKLIQALESLTLLHNLKFLTMLNWAEIIPQRNLLHNVRTWCPICYDNWHKNKQIIYEPLLWTLKEVKICLHHNQPLFTQCPHCKKENRLLAWNSRPGYCSKCQKWLGLSQENVSSEPITFTEPEIEWQNWVTKNIGDLIAAAPNLSPPPKEKIHEALSAYVNIITSGNTAKFAQYIGRGHTQTRRWCIGTNLPKIDTLLDICFKLKISLLDFLTEEVSITDFNNLSIPKPAELNRATRSSSNPVHTSTEVLHALQTALTENPPPSLVEVAKRLGYKRNTVLYYHSSDLCKAIAARYEEYKKAKKIDKLKLILEEVLANQEYPPPSMQEVVKRFGISFQNFKLYFPELCSAISSRYDSYCQEESQKRKEKVRQEVRQVAIKLNAEGIKPTNHWIAKYLTTPATILQKEAITAAKEIRQELGWEE
jgi:TniQ